jgi:ATP-dependent Clp protease ATP-binding subunit ClpC
MTVYLLLAALAGALAGAGLMHRRRTAPPVTPAPTDPAVQAAPEADLIDWGNALAPFFEASAHPKDLLAYEPFETAVAAVSSGPRSMLDLLAYAAGSSPVVACIALEAISRRDDDYDAVDALLATLQQRYGWRAYFGLRALHARTVTPVVARVLTRLDETWLDPLPLGWLAEFLGWRQEVGERMTWAGTLHALTPEKRVELDALVAALGDALPEPLRTEYAAWQRERTDLAYLRTIGRVRDEDEPADAQIIDHPALLRIVDEVEAVLCSSTPRPVVLVGEPGVGKGVVLARLVQRLRRNGWIAFDTSASELLAGQSFIGQLEDRVLRTVRETAGKNVVWLISGGVHELLYAGQTIQNPAGILDQLYPYLESGALRLVGETEPAAFETLLQHRPRLRAVLKPIRIAPLSADETHALARQWAVSAHEVNDDAVSQTRTPRVVESVLHEAQQLAAQHLGDRAAPGGLLRFLKLAAERVRARAGESIQLDDLLRTLSSLSGLPLDVLDDRIALDLDRLRSFFTARVLGQEEAVDALVERVALIKAGLTDPTRPAGVFLFVGPTGTGKTELAKSLAEYLFGSPDRMIRLDMSEFQDLSSLGRLLGSRGEAGASSTSLIDEVRKQPFSVVLLDELEKAHPRVWDLFLQLFDDGRLTDQSGNTASFRNTIIIMTSNAGSKAGGGIGFADTNAAITTPDVQRALRETFRPEFINRIDRVVVFRPLARSIMRELLDKEIRDVLRRRGLRNRPWAIEWEESAIELLIRHGFSPTLGARPLKRAVERYLLSPLAISIVNRRIPEGDQFLLIGTAGDRLTVDFVDPDAVAAPEREEEPREEHAVPTLEDIVRAARGDAAEIDALAAEYDHLRAAVDGAGWHERKQEALASIARPDFWNSGDRFAVLGLAEYMDRIEVGLDTAGSLLGRLHGGTRADADRFPRDLVRRLAQQLYLVGEAVEGIAAATPRDAFVRVRAAADPGAEPGSADAFAARIARMYVRWAEQRRMQLQVLEERAAGDVAYAMVLAISGFAAYRILAPESGQHILEAPAQQKAFTRARAFVDVVAQPDQPPAGSVTLLKQATDALNAVPQDRSVVVRRYREEPSPLVRDSVRGWRTGRLDAVLDGDFDLMG